MPATQVAKSVPWSRLKPRRKYWFALPAPLCCVTAMPGISSSNVPGRCSGPLSMSCGVIEPALCDFSVERDLARYRCPEDVDGDRCFTSEQLQSLRQIYEGTRNSAGAVIYPGGPVGSEFRSTEPARLALQEFRRAQAEAEIRCF